MIRRHGTTLRALLMVADAAVAMACVVAVYSLRYATTPEASPISDPQTAVAPVALYAGLWVLLLLVTGGYRLRAHWRLRTEAMGIARATLWLALLSLSLLFLVDLTDLSRVFLLLLFPVQGIVTLGLRAGLRTVFMTMRMRGHNNRYVLILGTGPGAQDFAQRIEDHTAFGLRVLGFAGEPPAPSNGHSSRIYGSNGNTPDGIASNGHSPERRWPYLGPISEVPRYLHSHVVDEVAVCLPQSDWAHVEEVITLCQAEGKIVRIPLETPDVESRMQFVEDLDGMAVLSIVRGPDRVLSLAFKRAVDIAASVAALALLAPFMAVIGVYIALRDGRPILFRQTRVGIHGRAFSMLKFRTMERDAEKRLAELAPLSDTRGPAFKMADDPRITPWGRWLRRTSIDELPQFWNVLRGHMSLVGPRPAPPREVDLYDVWHRRRLSMKPGLTGLWQVSSRLDGDFEDRARLDLDYIDRWSLWLDLRIVVRSVPAVLGADGR